MTENIYDVWDIQHGPVTVIATTEKYLWYRYDRKGETYRTNLQDAYMRLESEYSPDWTDEPQWRLRDPWSHNIFIAE